MARYQLVSKSKMWGDDITTTIDVVSTEEFNDDIGPLRSNIQGLHNKDRELATKISALNSEKNEIQQKLLVVVKTLGGTNEKSALEQIKNCIASDNNLFKELAAVKSEISKLQNWQKKLPIECKNIFSNLLKELLTPHYQHLKKFFEEVQKANRQLLDSERKNKEFWEEKNKELTKLRKDLLEQKQSFELELAILQEIETQRAETWEKKNNKLTELKNALSEQKQSFELELAILQETETQRAETWDKKYQKFAELKNDFLAQKEKLTAEQKDFQETEAQITETWKEKKRELAELQKDLLEQREKLTAEQKDFQETEKQRAETWDKKYQELKLLQETFSQFRQKNNLQTKSRLENIKSWFAKKLGKIRK